MTHASYTDTVGHQTCYSDLVMGQPSGNNEGRLTPELSRPPTGALVARLLPAASAEQEACHQRVGRRVGFSELLGGPGHLQHA